MIVQIKAVNQIDGEVVWCNNPADACAFGVYMGEPDEFRWLADFHLYLNARAWAEQVAKDHNAELEDCVYPN